MQWDGHSLGLSGSSSLVLVSGSIPHPLLPPIPPGTSRPALPRPRLSTRVTEEPSEETEFDESTLCWAKKSSDEKHREKQNLTVAVFHREAGPLGPSYPKFTVTLRRSGIVPSLTFFSCLRRTPPGSASRIGASRKIFTASCSRLFPTHGRQRAMGVRCNPVSCHRFRAAPELQLGPPEAAGVEHGLPATCTLLGGSNRGPVRFPTWREQAVKHRKRGRAAPGLGCGRGAAGASLQDTAGKDARRGASLLLPTQGAHPGRKVWWSWCSSVLGATCKAALWLWCGKRCWKGSRRGMKGARVAPGSPRTAVEALQAGGATWRRAASSWGRSVKASTPSKIV